MLILNRDDATFVMELVIPLRRYRLESVVGGASPAHPLCIYGGREWVILPVSSLLLKWRAQLLDNDQGATSLVLRSNPKMHHSFLARDDGA